MGDYPYPSSYLTGNPDILLPAFPMREMCSEMEKEDDLLVAMSNANNVFMNASKTETCFDVPDYYNGVGIDGTWMYLMCTEMVTDDEYFAMDGVNDMFYKKPFNLSLINDNCQRTFGL